MSITDILEETYRKSANKNISGDVVVHGIMVGIVVENNNDKFPGMVRVQIPTRDDRRNVLQWMKVASFMGGKSWGGYFIPEIGEQVIIAFGEGNINNAYVIGSVFKNDSEILSRNYTDGNYKKAFFTKGGNEILIDDEQDKQKIIIKTNGGQSVEIDDENKLISIGDKQGKNLVEMKTEDGIINMKTENKFTLNVNGVKIEISGDSGKMLVKADNIDIEASQNINIKGQTVKVDSSTLNFKASGSAVIESSGVLQVKGATVKLG